VHHVAGGKNTRHAGLEAVIHHRPAGHGVHLHAGLARELVFGDEPHREQQCIAGHHLFRTGNGVPALVHQHGLNRLDALAPDDAFDRMAQVQRNIIIQQALDVVARQPGQVGHNFQHAVHMGAFQRQAAGHNHANIARAEDHELFARHVTFHVHPALGSARRIDARRA